jgi:hypothetical protein
MSNSVNINIETSIKIRNAFKTYCALNGISYEQALIRLLKSTPERPKLDINDEKN